MEKKNSVWTLNTITTATAVVEFDEEVTLQEAIDRFNDGDIVDVIDENILGEEAIGGSTE